MLLIVRFKWKSPFDKNTVPGLFTITFIYKSIIKETYEYDKNKINYAENINIVPRY